MRCCTGMPSILTSRHIFSLPALGATLGSVLLAACRTPILLLLAFASAAAAAQPVPVSPRQPTAEERRELDRLSRLARRWADEARERHGLVWTVCFVAGPAFERTACRFRIDGIMVSLTKPGRAPGTPEATLLSIGMERGDRGERPTDGAWIRDGDLFEVEAGGRVYLFSCATEPSRGVPVRCLPIGDPRHVLDRLSLPRARYSRGEGFGAAAGRGFVDGSVRILHNGRPVELKPLIAAARDFARQDFEAIAASAAPPPLPSISIGPISEEEQGENARLLDLARRWANDVRDRQGLTDANCSFGSRPPPVHCGFRLDGISLSVGRDVPDAANIKADLGFGHVWQRRHDRAVILEGSWFKAGDLFEVDLGGAVYAYLCRPHLAAHPELVQCRQVREFGEMAGRASHRRARYRLTDPPAEATVGEALVDGRIALRHNGRPRSLAPLVGAARDFARQDFARLAEVR
jgi:hypothetical protein